MPKQRGTSMSTGMHVDPGAVLSADDEFLDEDAGGDVPPGAVRFAVDAEDIAQTIAAEGTEVSPCTVHPVQ